MKKTMSTGMEETKQRACSCAGKMSSLIRKDSLQQASKIKDGPPFKILEKAELCC